MQRARQIAQQKTDRQQVEEYPERARNAVVRSAALAVHVLDRNFNDRRSVPRRQGRNEAMHFSVQWNLLEDFAAIGLESGAEIMDINAAQLGHEPVGATRRKTS